MAGTLSLTTNSVSKHFHNLVCKVQVVLLLIPYSQPCPYSPAFQKQERLGTRLIPVRLKSCVTILFPFQDLKTNQKGRYKMGAYTDKQLGTNGGGLALQKGDKLGCFRLGSSIVLIFEAPREFKFLVEPGQKVLYGQPLGSIEDCKNGT